MDQTNEWSTVAERLAPTAEDLERVARTAAEAVAGQRQRRVIIVSAISATIAGLLVTLTVMLFIVSADNRDNRKQGLENATTNCQTIASSRPQGNDRAVVEQIILRVADEALALFPQRFRQGELDDVNRLIAAARREYHGVLDVQPIRSFAGLNGYVALLPGVDCSQLR